MLAPSGKSAKPPTASPIKGGKPGGGSAPASSDRGDGAQPLHPPLIKPGKSSGPR